MKIIIKCEHCGATNPNSANFCRICGEPIEVSLKNRLMSYRCKIKDFLKKIYKSISSFLNVKCLLREHSINKSFTLDVFPQIDFSPVSVIPISFINKFWLIVDIILLVWIYAFYNISDVRYMLKDMVGEYNYHILHEIMPLLGVIFGIISLTLIFSFIKKLIFLANSSYIEKNFTGTLVRIAKRCKLGLFDTKNKKVRLYSRYDSIEKFDDKYLVVTRKGKKGIYSIPSKKIIVPVSFDSISSFSNSVCTATAGTMIYHFDIKGNRLN